MKEYFLAERHTRIEQAKNPDVHRAILEVKDSCVGKTGGVGKEILNTLDLMREIEYRHTGLSSDQYMLHPIRVMKLALAHIDEPTEKLLSVCLLHNVLEVGILSDWLKKRIQQYRRELETLAVNRELSMDKDYLDTYYKKIAESRLCSSVKVMDKLDNIFMICSNPDGARRQKYLMEIHRYVVPVAEGVEPGLGTFIGKLADCAQSLGYLKSR